MSLTAAPRFLALDILRGLTICFMIIVNTQGSGSPSFAPLEHAAWHGFTPTDLVFPTFLFVVGNAMSFALPKYKQLGTSSVLIKLLKRSFIIFLLGYLMYWFPFFRVGEDGSFGLSPISETRILGVLQRIALAYLFAGLMIHFLSKKLVIGLSIFFLVGYWVLLALGGDLSLTGNIAYKVDLWLLGPAHLYKGEGVPFDPEGFLSTFPSVVNVIAGYYAGVFIQKSPKSTDAIVKILIAGLAALTIAYFWDYILPINKKLWTSSFAVYTIALSLILLGVLLYFVEIKGFTKGSYFFQVFGRNPLFIYLLADLLAEILRLLKTSDGTSWYHTINDSVFQKLLPGPWGALAFSICFMLICWLVGYWMDKKKIYIRV